MPYLIDGHNLIGQMRGLHLSDPDDERKLVELLRAFLVRVKKKGTVVFDRGQPGGRSSWSNSVLAVHFAPPGRTADELILARIAKDKNPRGLLVVSGDHAITVAARRLGATVVRPQDFADELLIKPPVSHKKPTGLTPDEIEFWERQFKNRQK